MTPTLESLGLDRLSQSDRVTVANALLDSVAADFAPTTLTDAQLRELDRRIDDDDANPDDVIPWEEVKRRLVHDGGANVSSHLSAGRVEGF